MYHLLQDSFRCPPHNCTLSKRRLLACIGREDSAGGALEAQVQGSPRPSPPWRPTATETGGALSTGSMLRLPRGSQAARQQASLVTPQQSSEDLCPQRQNLAQDVPSGQRWDCPPYGHTRFHIPEQRVCLLMPGCLERAPQPGCSVRGLFKDLFLTVHLRPSGASGSAGRLVRYRTAASARSMPSVLLSGN